MSGEPEDLPDSISMPKIFRAVRIAFNSVVRDSKFCANDAFNNDYCGDCGVKDKCIEGPYALRVSNDGTIRPCLIRNDNIICLDESGYRLRREQEKKTESNFLYAPV